MGPCVRGDDAGRRSRRRALRCKLRGLVLGGQRLANWTTQSFGPECRLAQELGIDGHEGMTGEAFADSGEIGSRSNQVHGTKAVLVKWQARRAGTGQGAARPA